MGKKRAFTLIELLVVITIIALLLAILIPALARAREHAKRSVCKSNMKSICTAIVTFADNNNDLVPPLRIVSGQYNYLQDQNHRARWFRTGTSDWWNLGFLWRDNYIRQGEVFYCPSSRYPFRYKDYNYNPDGEKDSAGHPLPFPQNFQPPGGTAGSGVRVSYSYDTICISVTNRERKFKKIYQFNAVNSLMLVDVLEGGVAHINGWNVTRGDCSIVFITDKTIVEDMENCAGNLTNDDFTCWDKIMNKFLQR